MLSELKIKKIVDWPTAVIIAIIGFAIAFSFGYFKEEVNHGYKIQTALWILAVLNIGLAGWLGHKKGSVAGTIEFKRDQIKIEYKNQVQVVKRQDFPIRIATQYKKEQKKDVYLAFVINEKEKPLAFSFLQVDIPKFKEVMRIKYGVKIRSV